MGLVDWLLIFSPPSATTTLFPYAAFSNLTRKDAADDTISTYAVLLADTVVAKPAPDTPDVATAYASKAWNDVAYFLEVTMSWPLSLGWPALGLRVILGVTV